MVVHLLVIAVSWLADSATATNDDVGRQRVTSTVSSTTWGTDECAGGCVTGKDMSGQPMAIYEL